MTKPIVMKFNSFVRFSLCVCFLLLPILLVRTEDVSTMPLLMSPWDLPVPDLFFCDTSEFLFRFDMSNKIENYMTKMHLLRGEDCDIDIWDNNYLIPQVVYDLAPPGNGDFVRQVALVLKADPSLIGNSPVYDVSEDGATGGLSFCLRLETFTQDNGSGLPTRVNWRDVIYSQVMMLQEGVRRMEMRWNDGSSSFQSHRHLEGLDCSNGYDIAFENWWSASFEAIDPVNVTYTESDDGIGVMVNNNFIEFTTSISYDLRAFECDENYVERTVPVYKQGDIFRVCITPDDHAKSEGLVMNRVDSMVFKKDGTSLLQYAVEGGQADFFGFSVFKCTPGSSVCWVETLLLAEWFARAGTVSVSGVATLQFDDTDRRFLHTEYQRDLQSDQSSKERAKFVFKFPVTTFQETVIYTSRNSSSVSQLQAILLVLLCFILITNTVFYFWIRQSRRIRNTIQGEQLLKSGKPRPKAEINTTVDNHDVKVVQSQKRSKKTLHV